MGVALSLGFIGIFFLWPVLKVIGLGFFGEFGGLNIESAIEILQRPRTLRALSQTLAQAGVASIVAAVIGIPLAFLLYRFRFPGRDLFRSLVIVPFVMPTVVVGTAFNSLLSESGWLGSLGMAGSFPAVVAALVFFNISVVVRTVGASWEQLDTTQEEAAASLGAGRIRVFATITLPRLFPAIASSFAIVFLFCATSFGLVMTLGGPAITTIETEIYFMTVQLLDLQAASVLSVLQFAVVLLALGLSAWLRRRTGGVAVALASRTMRLKLKNWPLVLLGIAVLTALALPLANLVQRSFTGVEGFTLQYYRNLFDSGQQLSVDAAGALWNSLQAATLASAIALSIGIISALTLNRLATRHRFASATLDTIMMLPLGISTVTVGLGFLLALNTPPFDLRSSAILVPIAQSLIALPLVLRVLLPVLNRINPRLRQAASSMGAAPWQVVRDVDLRMSIKPIAAGFGFAFAASLGEFGAAVFLARADRPTLPVVIYRLLGRPGAENYETALAASVLLAVMTIAVIMLAERASKGVSGVF